MRKSFEGNLHQYNEIAKGEAEEKRSARESGVPADLQEIETVLAWETKKNASDRETSIAAQREIYAIQRTKQSIFEKLKNDLALLDEDPDALHWEKSAKKITATEGRLAVALPNGKVSEISEAELLTDGEWGIKYAPDENVPRNVRKRYLIETAKRKLRRRLNHQIFIDEIASQKTPALTKGAYSRKFEEEELEQKMPPGILAERMVDGLLKKISLGPDASFEVLEADVHMDVSKKIDFIIRRKSHSRGVGVEAENRSDIGVQFTTSSNREKLNMKEEQLRRARSHLSKEDMVEDIVLISVPLVSVESVYEEWAKNPAPGGPEKLWSAEIKKTIFKKILSGMFSEEELEEQWLKAESAI